MGEMADMIINNFLDDGEDLFNYFSYPKRPKKIKVAYDEIVTDTDKAFLFRIKGDTTVWLPKSECIIDEKENTVIIPGWLYLRHKDEFGD